MSRQPIRLTRRGEFVRDGLIVLGVSILAFPALAVVIIALHMIGA